MIWCGQGRPAGAVQLLDGASEAARTTGGNTQTLAWSLCARSTLAVAGGDAKTALATAQEAFDVNDDGKHSHTAGAAARGLAAALLEVGNAEQEAELLE